ncbi:hypothetical protein B0H13DRAFT_1542403, partial [Mycena leptocephala]
QRRDDELPLDLAQASSPPSTLHPMPETPVKKTKDRKTAKSSIAKFTPKTARSGWQRLGSSHTTEVYKTFEQWCNDYNSHDYETADDLVEVKHLGHPVDRPKDIRARPFILQWITPDRDVPKALSDDPHPVFRAVYRCSGNCSDLPLSQNDNSSDDDRSDEPLPRANWKGSKKQAEELDSDGDTKRQTRACPQKVIIHVEVLSDNLSKAIIYQQHTHRE